MSLLSTASGKNDSAELNLNDVCDKYYPDIRYYCASHIKASYVSYVDDITNDVFALLCEKWQKLENLNYRSWLYETTDNLLKNFRKKQICKAAKEMYIDELLDDTLTYEQNFETMFEDISTEEIEKCKNEIIENLSEKDRQLFDMKYTQKLPIAKIGTLLSISENNVKQKLFRLREKIKDMVSKKLRQIR